MASALLSAGPASAATAGVTAAVDDDGPTLVGVWASPTTLGGVSYSASQMRVSADGTAALTAVDAGCGAQVGDPVLRNVTPSGLEWIAERYLGRCVDRWVFDALAVSADGRTLTETIRGFRTVTWTLIENAQGGDPKVWGENTTAMQTALSTALDTAADQLNAGGDLGGLVPVAPLRGPGLDNAANAPDARAANRFSHKGDELCLNATGLGFKVGAGDSVAAELGPMDLNALMKKKGFKTELKSGFGAVVRFTGGSFCWGAKITAWDPMGGHIGVEFPLHAGADYQAVAYGNLNYTAKLPTPSIPLPGPFAATLELGLTIPFTLEATGGGKVTGTYIASGLVTNTTAPSLTITPTNLTAGVANSNPLKFSAAFGLYAKIKFAAGALNAGAQWTDPNLSGTLAITDGGNKGVVSGQFCSKVSAGIEALEGAPLPNAVKAKLAWSLPLYQNCASTPDVVLWDYPLMEECTGDIVSHIPCIFSNDTTVHIHVVTTTHYTGGENQYWPQVCKDGVGNSDSTLDVRAGQQVLGTRTDTYLHSSGQDVETTMRDEKDRYFAVIRDTYTGLIVVPQAGVESYDCVGTSVGDHTHSVVAP